NTLDIFDSVLDNLLNVQINSQGIAIYQTNFDMAIVHDEILNRVEHRFEGVIQLKNCFSDGIVRMQAIYYEDVLKTRPTQPGRSKLGTSRLKILNFQKELKEAKRNKKTIEHSQTMESRSQPQEESSDQRDIIMQEQQENETGNKQPLILSQSEPTNEEMREKLNTLSDEWDLSRIKQHVQYQRKKRAVENAH
ncbi:17276_t:CDS:2, partial [Rhizophagus irregularis]